MTDHTGVWCRQCHRHWLEHSIFYAEPPANATPGDFGPGGFKGLFCPRPAPEPVPLADR